MSSAIVIGAGIGGIASAIRLAIKGYDVEVFEANASPGGKLNEIRLGSYRFDAGPSLFTMPELVDELFQLAGKDPKQYFRYERVSEICRYFYEDETEITAHADPLDFASEVEDKLGVPAKKVLKHLGKSDYIYRSTAHLFLERSLHRLSSYLRFETLRSFLKLPFLWIDRSMHEANEKALKDARLVQLFDRYATYNGSDPYQAPGTLHIIPHLEFNKGAYFPEGGMYSITRSLYGLAQDLGIRFHFKTPVKRITVEERKAIGVLADKEYHAQKIVCNMDVGFAYRKLLPDQKHPSRILEQERSSSALIFYWGIAKSFPKLLLHNIFFSANYQEEFKDIFKNKEFSLDPTVYVHISSKMNEDDAPEGKENWFVMINVSSDRGQDWDTLIPKARAAILTKLSRLLKEDIESLIEEEDILEPRTIESRTSSYKGALYGTASNKKMAAFFRHPNFSSEIDDLYFTGGSVHPGGGIPLALSSAKIVDSLILQEK